METVTVHGITFTGAAFAPDRRADRITPTTSAVFDAIATADRNGLGRSVKRAQAAKRRAIATRRAIAARR